MWKMINGREIAEITMDHVDNMMICAVNAEL